MLPGHTGGNLFLDARIRPGTSRLTGKPAPWRLMIAEHVDRY